MYYLFEMGTSVMECVFLHILFGHWFGLREQNRLRFLLGMGGFLLLNILYTMLPLDPYVRALAGTICTAAAGWFLYACTPLQAVGGGVLNIIINILTEYLTLLLINLLQFDTSDLMSYGPGRLSYVVAAKLVNLFAVLLFAAVFGKMRKRISLRRTLPLLACQLMSGYICEIFYRAAAHTDAQPASYVMVLIGLLFINVIMIVLVDHLTVAAEQAQRQALAEQNYAMQQEYYQRLQQKQAETRTLWHDMQKYVLAMEAMVTGDDPGAQQALEAIQKELTEAGKLVDTENHTLNVILNHYIQKADTHRIPVMLDISVPPELGVPAVDLSVMLGNLLDNAIEACAGLPEEQRQIRVIIRQRHQTLLCQVENTCPETAAQKAGAIHGLGLQNIRACAAKYHGHLETERRQGRYAAALVIPVR